ALWVTPTGYSALGSLLIKQVPKATAAGMTIPADVQSHLAALPLLVPTEIGLVGDADRLQRAWLAPDQASAESDRGRHDYSGGRAVASCGAAVAGPDRDRPCG